MWIDGLCSLVWVEPVQAIGCDARVVEGAMGERGVNSGPKDVISEGLFPFLAGGNATEAENGAAGFHAYGGGASVGEERDYRPVMSESGELRT